VPISICEEIVLYEPTTTPEPTTDFTTYEPPDRAEFDEEAVAMVIGGLWELAEGQRNTICKNINGTFVRPP